MRAICGCAGAMNANAWLGQPKAGREQMILNSVRPDLAHGKAYVAINVEKSEAVQYCRGTVMG